MNNPLQRFPGPRTQRGFSLVAVMIIMVVVSLLGVAASQLVLMGERSSRYDRDWQIAWQAAEAALIDAEFDIRGPNTSSRSRKDDFTNTSLLGFFEGCGKNKVDRGLCLTFVGPKPIWYTIDFKDQSGTAPSVQVGEFTERVFPSGSGVQPARLPRYIIEAIPDQSPGYSARTPRLLHRVTAMGFGPHEDTQAVLQMVFRKE